MTPERLEQVALIYRTALELEPARRAAYLAEACGGDESLRQGVESLLGSETRRGGLIDQPALEATRTTADDQALALCGEANQAKPLTDELSRLYPEDTLCNELWLPLIRAASALQQNKAALAIEQLQPASRYEAAAEFWPAHLRGQAYLKLGRGAEAVAEFQKILDHRGYAPLSSLYSLAHLGRARAAGLTGDSALSRKGYKDFFAVWKDADADQPILSEARREHEKQ
jgi:hypothetical protein